MTRQYNGGKWTEARFNSFIKSLLRSGSRKWEPRYTVLNKAYVGQKINPSSGRLCKHYECQCCKKHFPSKMVQVDHIEPVIDPITGFTTWDEVISRMFCEEDNFQVLCIPCHTEKSNKEKALAKERRHDK